MIGSLSIDVCNGDIHDWFALTNYGRARTVSRLHVRSWMGVSQQCTYMVLRLTFYLLLFQPSITPPANALHSLADPNPATKSINAYMGQAKVRPHRFRFYDAMHLVGYSVTSLPELSQNETYAWHIRVLSPLTRLQSLAPSSTGEIFYRLEYEGQVQFLFGQKMDSPSPGDSHTFMINQSPPWPAGPTLNIDILYDMPIEGLRLNQITILGRAKVPPPAAVHVSGKKARSYEVIDDQEQSTTSICKARFPMEPLPASQPPKVNAEPTPQPALNDTNISLDQQAQTPVDELPPPPPPQIRFPAWSLYSPLPYPAPRWGYRSSIWK
ncbi:hypothetical protein DL93DRAFT_597788 [Clavulina sp. PMI_390]|nr:hypothetical protein DL93DRAFT_597788 [Clavulina sp. PMI_390]